MQKDPSARLNYGFDWGKWLEPGDAIASAVWSVPVGVTKESESVIGAITSVKLSGGVVGATYQVTCHVTTTAGLEDSRTWIIEVVSR